MSSASPKLPVILQEEPTGGYVVQCPLFDGCFSQGDTIEEALENIKEVIAMCLEEAIEEGRLTKSTIPKTDVQYVTLE